MKVTEDVLASLCNQAQTAVTKAGTYIKSQYLKRVQTVYEKPAMNSHASSVVTQIDIESQRIILEQLNDSISKYDLGLLTEEAEDDQSRLFKDYFWCIDPLDGTLPFIEQKEGWAVSIALISKDGVPVIGVVWEPINEIIYKAIRGRGAYKNNMRITPINTTDSTANTLIYMDRSTLKMPYYDEWINLLKVNISENIEIISHRGAVMNAIGVLESQNGCYVKLPKNENGGGSIWDFAATKCIFDEAAMKVTNAFGERLFLNVPHTVQLNTQGVIYVSSNSMYAQVHDICVDLIKRYG